MFSGKARKEAIEGIIRNLPPRFHRRARLFAWLLLLVKGNRMRESMRTLAGTLTMQFRQRLPQIIEQTVRRSTGVLSLTARHDNLLMWSQLH
jgi:hypothetical protein